MEPAPTARSYRRATLDDAAARMPATCLALLAIPNWQVAVCPGSAASVPKSAAREEQTL
jgi:hypothetical protein